MSSPWEILLPKRRSARAAITPELEARVGDSVDPTHSIDIVAQRAIGNSYRLALVRVTGKLLLLACTADTITLLRTVDEDHFANREEASFFQKGDNLDAIAKDVAALFR